MRQYYLLCRLLVAGTGGCSRSPIPGCDYDELQVAETYVQYGTFRDAPFVTVWSDIPTAGGVGGLSADPDRVEVSYKKASGALDWKAVTSDGKTGAMILNGKEYRLENGAVFIVRTEPEARVTQVKCDLSRSTATKETWERMAKEVTELRDFVSKAPAK